jgi:hypothetical protein
MKEFRRCFSVLASLNPIMGWSIRVETCRMFGRVSSYAAGIVVVAWSSATGGVCRTCDEESCSVHKIGDSCR